MKSGYVYVLRDRKGGQRWYVFFDGKALEETWAEREQAEAHLSKLLRDEHDCRDNAYRCLSEDDEGRVSCCYSGELLCPVCGKHIGVEAKRTVDNRLIGSCGDAFREERFYVNPIPERKKP